MTDAAPYDPRRVCNLILDEADRAGLPVSNLALQKLLYFTHARFLIRTGQPLVSGYFEAWQYGPVHSAAHKAFRAAGKNPITFRAQRIDSLSGTKTPLSPLVEPSILRLVGGTVTSLGGLTPGRLVDLSHARGGPWHFVVSEAEATMAFGLRISDAVTIERFRNLKVSVGTAPASGEPGEDTPLAGHGFGADRTAAG